MIPNPRDKLGKVSWALPELRSLPIIQWWHAELKVLYMFNGHGILRLEAELL